MMSAYTDEATIDRSRVAGAWLFLPKPVPLPNLIEAFESLAQQPAAALVVEDEVIWPRTWRRRSPRRDTKSS